MLTCMTNHYPFDSLFVSGAGVFHRDLFVQAFGDGVVAITPLVAPDPSQGMARERTNGALLDVAIDAHAQITAPSGMDCTVDSWQLAY